MKEIKVENPTVKSCAPYGTFTRLTDYEAFRGDGWECWMTEGLCMDQPGKLSRCQCESTLPFILNKMYKSSGQKLLICSQQEMVIAVASRNDGMKPEEAEIKAFIMKPGEILLLQPGIWHDICRGAEVPVEYYELVSEDEETETGIEEVKIIK